jgi:hypothetical protein
VQNVSISVSRFDTPIKCYFNEEGKPVVLSGHRRLTALRLLAQRNVPGCTPNMRVTVQIVPKPTHDDSGNDETAGE